MNTSSHPYRGRIAPTPTGLLHLGHAATFWTAHERAMQQNGVLLYRDEDLDPDRCKPHFTKQQMEDLSWLGLRWLEGPDCGGAFAPYRQSERRDHYLSAWATLRDSGHIYPCERSRRELREAAVTAPHDEEETNEPIYPREWRPSIGTGRDTPSPAGFNWRFRVPDGEVITFEDQRCGTQRFTAGVDFGDFVIWRRDDVPNYELAVVVDDAAMQITEVVRGEDLLKSTARQILLYRALGLTAPAFYHCRLICDESGKRLAKRHDALSIKSMREAGKTPQAVLQLTGCNG